MSRTGEGPTPPDLGPPTPRQAEVWVERRRSPCPLVRVQEGPTSAPDASAPTDTVETETTSTSPVRPRPRVHPVLSDPTQGQSPPPRPPPVPTQGQPPRRPPVPTLG